MEYINENLTKFYTIDYDNIFSYGSLIFFNGNFETALENHEIIKKFYDGVCEILPNNFGIDHDDDFDNYYGMINIQGRIYIFTQILISKLLINYENNNENKNINYENDAEYICKFLTRSCKYIDCENLEYYLRLHFPDLYDLIDSFVDEYEQLMKISKSFSFSLIDKNKNYLFRSFNNNNNSLVNTINVSGIVIDVIVLQKIIIVIALKTLKMGKSFGKHYCIYEFKKYCTDIHSKISPRIIQAEYIGFTRIFDNFASVNFKLSENEYLHETYNCELEKFIYSEQLSTPICESIVNNNPGYFIEDKTHHFYGIKNFEIENYPYFDISNFSKYVFYDPDSNSYKICEDDNYIFDDCKIVYEINSSNISLKKLPGISNHNHHDVISNYRGFFYINSENKLISICGDHGIRYFNNLYASDENKYIEIVLDENVDSFFMSYDKIIIYKRLNNDSFYITGRNAIFNSINPVLISENINHENHLFYDDTNVPRAIKLVN